MIRALQKMRLSLIENQKLTKYIKYALGEILLVVIGILIALALNNWNENRKNKAFEKDILLLISKNLEDDAEAISIALDKAERGNEMTNKLLSAIENKTDQDSLPFWMGKIICFERIQPQSSAFEVLKSKGFDILNDNNLSLNLIAYYDEVLPGLDESIKDVLMSFNSDWVPIIKQEFSDFAFQEYCIPRDPEQFYKKPSIISMFKLYRDNRTGEISSLKAGLKKNGDLKKRIQKHLS